MKFVAMFIKCFKTILYILPVTILLIACDFKQKHEDPKIPKHTVYDENKPTRDLYVYSNFPFPAGTFINMSLDGEDLGQFSTMKGESSWGVTYHFKSDVNETHHLMVKINYGSLIYDSSFTVENDNTWVLNLSMDNNKMVANLTSITKQNEIVDNKDSVNISIDKDYKSEVASVEDVFIKKGVKTKLKRSRTIEHDISYSETSGGEYSVGGTAEINLIVKRLNVEGKIVRRLDNSLATRFNEKETTEQEIEIDGNILDKSQVVWVDKFKTGKIALNADSTKYIYFKYRVGTTLTVQ